MNSDNTSLPIIPVRIASRDAISMMVPPFIEQNTSSETLALAKELLRVTREVRVLAGQFYLYTALTRSRPFSETIGRSNAQYGTRIVVGCLMRTMVVTIPALFDKDKRTSNLPRLIKAILEPVTVKHLNNFHKHCEVSAEAERSRPCLINYGRKLKSGGIKQEADRLTHVRQKHIAHFEADPEPIAVAGKAVVRDLDRVVIGLGVVVAEANVFAFGRRVDFPDLRKVLRQHAGDFCDALAVGSSPNTRRCST